jgi:hypothetical protein
MPCVVVQLLLLFGVAPVGVGGHGHLQQAGQQVVALGVGAGLFQSFCIGHLTWW